MTRTALASFLLLLLGLLPLSAQHSSEAIVDEDDLEDGMGKGQHGVAPTLPALDLPAGMLVDPARSIDSWRARQYLRLDPAAPPDENRTYEPEVYRDRLRRLPTLIALPYNDQVQRYIDHYTYRLRPSVSFMLGAQNFYLPTLEEALEAEELPLELKYLPCVESALDPHAAGRPDARGLWQLTTRDARRLGLTVNSLLDERLDPIKASAAAARRLKDLYAQFGDWLLVIAAYNGGEQSVRKAMARAGGSRDYWTLQPYLPATVRGYAPAFIAVNYVMNHYCDHNIAPLLADPTVETDTIMVGRDLSLQHVAQLFQLEPEALRDLNPQYRTGILPGASAAAPLRLPSSLVERFIHFSDTLRLTDAERYPPLPSARPAASVVQPDEPASPPDVSTLERAERISAPATRRPSRAATPSARSRAAKKSRRAAAQVKVRPGDTLEEIARRNGTTVKALKKKNRIKGDRIMPGDRLRLN